jgi:magnesium transporter
MLVLVENGKMAERDIAEAASGKGQYFGVYAADEAAGVLGAFGISEKPMVDAAANPSMVYESHEGFDFISVSDLSRKSLHAQPARVYIYLRKNLILLFSGHDAFAEKICADIGCATHVSYDRLLFVFFEHLTADDAGRLEKIEQEISGLENALIASKKHNCVKEIISLRKRLMVLKRYYEQMLTVLDELEENENGFLSPGVLRYFKIFAGRVDRLHHSVLNLRDYVTQVREAYQAEVDIGLNNIMKIFTVLTAIFLPLTLLVGWYGMNLKMPEFGWPFGYPMVIIIAVAIVVVCLTIFKRKKWF